MQTVNIGFCRMDSSENYHSPLETDDAYMNTQDWHPKAKTYTDISVLREIKEKKLKICMSALGLLLMLVLMALCVVGILYHKKVTSFEILHERYENATATLMIQENKAQGKEKMYEILKMKYEELDFACSKNQNSGQCEKEWKSLGLKCYYFSTEKLNWTQSRDYCVENGGHLVIITSHAEQLFVSSRAGETCWIGLNDLESEGNWIWVNNLSLNETGVEFWFSAPEGPSEPDNWKKEDPSGENCAALGHEIGYTHKWFDASCSKLKQFICEK